VLPQIWPQVSEAQARHICTFFRTISCPYSAHASDQVLQAQTEAIARRISPGEWVMGAPEGRITGDRQQIGDVTVPPTMLQTKPPASDDGSSHKSAHLEWV